MHVPFAVRFQPVLDQDITKFKQAISLSGPSFQIVPQIGGSSWPYVHAADSVGSMSDQAQCDDNLGGEWTMAMEIKRFKFWFQLGHYPSFDFR